MNMAIECDEWSCVSQLMCSNYMHVSIMQWQWNINFTMEDEHMDNVFRWNEFLCCNLTYEYDHVIVIIARNVVGL